MRKSRFTRIIALFGSLVFVVGCAKQPPAKETVNESVPAAETAKVPHAFDGMPAVGTEARCPVMDHAFKVSDSTESTVIDGKTYVFCCPGCKGKFEADHQSYLSKM